MSITHYEDGTALVEVRFVLIRDEAQQLWGQSIRGSEQRCYLTEDIRDAVRIAILGKTVMSVPHLAEGVRT